MTKELAVSPVKKLASMITTDSVKAQFANCLKDNADLFLASVLDVYSTDSFLQKCDPGSVLQEALKAATLKLPINKGLGFAYIVPYGGRAQMQIGYKGLIQLAMRTGQFRYLNADMVYKGEEVKQDRITGNIEIVGNSTGEEPIGYFAFMELLNGFRKVIYWSKDKCEAHGKRYSKTFNNGPWKSNFDTMAIKTVLRQLLSKYAPMSVEMIAAMEADREDYDAEAELIDTVSENANSEMLDMDAGVNKEHTESGVIDEPGF